MPESKTGAHKTPELIIRSQLEVVASCASHLDRHARALPGGDACVTDVFRALYGLSLCLLPKPTDGDPGSEVHKRALALIDRPEPISTYVGLLQTAIGFVQEHAAGIPDGAEVADDLSGALDDLARARAQQSGDDAEPGA